MPKIFSFLTLPILLVTSLFAFPVQAAVLGDVIINEVNWAGSSLSAADQWVELYNNTGTEVSLDGYTVAGVTLNATTCGTAPTIAANSYFLLSKYGKTNPASLLNVQADCVADTLTLSSTGEQLTLQSGGAVIDQTPTGSWPAGSNTNCQGDTPSQPCFSMARKANTATTGNDTAAWESSTRTLNIDSPYTYTHPTLDNNPWPGSSFKRDQKMTPKANNFGLSFCASNMQYEQGRVIVDASSSCGNIINQPLGGPKNSDYLLSGTYLDTTIDFTTGDYEFVVRIKNNTEGLAGNTKLLSTTVYSQGGVVEAPLRDITVADLPFNTWQEVTLKFSKTAGEGRFTPILYSYNTADLSVDSVVVRPTTITSNWQISAASFGACGTGAETDPSATYSVSAISTSSSCSMVQDSSSNVNFNNFGTGTYQVKLWIKSQSTLTSETGLSICLWYDGSGCGQVVDIAGTSIGSDYSAPITITLPYNGGVVTPVFWAKQTGIVINKIEYQKL